MLLDIYTNFSFENSTISLTLIIWGLYAGILIGGIASIYNKWYLGGVVRALLAAECLSPEAGKTLSELGRPAWGMKRALRDGTALRKSVSIANPGECLLPSEHKRFGAIRRFFTGSAQPNPKLDLTLARLYVPEEKKYHAEVRYEKKGSAPIWLLIGGIILLVIAVLATFFIPELLQMIDNAITMFKNL